uniref:Uncharacterized protein n=1 Tax=Plectus sambesii TaxID=2011161 RepID=A0A914WEF1_9BILA
MAVDDDGASSGDRKWRSAESGEQRAPLNHCPTGRRARRLHANNALKSRCPTAVIEQIRFRSEFRRPPFVGPPHNGWPANAAQPTRRRQPRRR